MQFDFIIVGAGSAGCVLANKLSESGTFSVCLIEAGGESNSRLVTTPGLFGAHMFTKRFNWAYDAEKETDIRNGDAVFVPRGKGLGGSSAINAMVYIRGQKEDYDHWESLGNKGWSYESLLPLFKEMECNERFQDEYHGSNGSLNVSDLAETYPLTDTFVKAAEESSIPLNHDFNGETQEGIGTFQFTIKDGERCGAYAAFLKDVRHRSNLTILTKTQALKVDIANGKATGVVCQDSNDKFTLRARKEIILASGAIDSPKLLMLSGIGDPTHLAKHNLECIAPIPGVGKNLQEHVDSCVLVTSQKTDGFTASFSGVLKMAPEVLKYLTSRSGKLANSITECGGFVAVSENAERPEVQYHMVPLLFDDCGRDVKLMSMHGYSVHACVLRPKSRGEIRLRSSDPQDAPVIDFNFFSDEEGHDKKVLIEGIRKAREILSMSAFDAYRGEELSPGKDALSDEEIFAKAKETLGVVYHPVGTCKMGSDDMAVVDDTLQVRGVKGLRVVDASIMPTIISGNTNATTMVIAAKASAFILEKYSR